MRCKCVPKTKQKIISTNIKKKGRVLRLKRSIISGIGRPKSSKRNTTSTLTLAVEKPKTFVEKAKEILRHKGRLEERGTEKVVHFKTWNFLEK